MEIALTVIEAVRNFADVVNRAYSPSWLVDTSFRASVLILLLACLRPVLRPWIGSRALAWLWLAILEDAEGTRQEISRALPVVLMATGKRHLALRVREIRAFRPVAPWRGVVALAATLALVAIFTVGGAVAEAVGSTPPTVAAPPALVGISPGPVVRRPTALDPSTSAPQVEIEAEFIEISESGALALEKSTPPSSPVASIVHQFSVWCVAQSSAASGRIFCSPLVLPDDFDLLLRQLNQVKGLDLLSGPRVTTKSGQKATVEITREFIYPTAYERGQDPAGRPRTTPTKFDRTDTGVTLEVDPTVSSERDVIDLSVLWKVKDFDGFAGDDGKPVTTEEAGAGVKHPVFTTQSVETVASLSSGASVLFGMDGRHDYVKRVKQSLPPAPVPEESGAVSGETEDKALLLIIVTARLIEGTPLISPRLPEHP